MSHEQRLANLGIELPAVAEPRGSYVPALAAGDFCYTSAQLPFRGGEVVFLGQVGAQLSLEAGQEAARLAALNAIAAVRHHLGTLDRVSRVLRLVGYVSTAPGFTDAHLVTNGASDVLERIFGRDGHHVRSSVGVASLPLGAAVAIELTALLKPAS